MKKYLKTDEWNIIEDQFHPDRQRMSESIFSLGNGRFGQRGYFEEPYSSDSYRGSFVAGITFLDKTRVGWWKNGFPPYYTRIPKAADWSRINLRLIDEELDLAGWDVDSFNRRLDMKEGISYRDMEVTSPRGNQLRIHIAVILDKNTPFLVFRQIHVFDDVSPPGTFLHLVEIGDAAYVGIFIWILLCHHFQKTEGHLEALYTGIVSVPVVVHIVFIFIRAGNPQYDIFLFGLGEGYPLSPETADGNHYFQAIFSDIVHIARQRCMLKR